VWSEEGEETGDHGEKAIMLQVWGRRTQKIEVSKK